MTVWLPQLMVSVSPAAAPVPVRPTTTGVPFEASAALMPPPPFSGIDGDRRRRRRRRVDGHRLAVGVGTDIAHGVDDPRLVGEARAVRRGIGIAPGGRRAGGDIEPAGAAVAADLHRLAGAERAVRARHRQRRVVGDKVARRGAAVGGNRRDRNRRRRRRRVDRYREVAVEFAPTLPAMSVSLAVTLNVPWPCAAIVPAGTVTVALLPEMSAARSV